ncbi:MAG: zinc ribbon domain-containing protein [Planctomycetes bacterium]|nr:zinc ribbon domain-containing protein [Planctomycetota bacterium]
MLLDSSQEIANYASAEPWLIFFSFVLSCGFVGFVAQVKGYKFSLGLFSQALGIAAFGLIALIFVEWSKPWIIIGSMVAPCYFLFCPVAKNESKLGKLKLKRGAKKELDDCPNCSSMISIQAKFCPECGLEVNFDEHPDHGYQRRPHQSRLPEDPHKDRYPDHGLR